MDDPHDLKRFVDAQAQVYADVVAELKAGRKQSHWMWFIFPQLKGLGSSHYATHYGIASLDEARAYGSHLILGPRLRECTALMLRATGRSALDVLGSPDDRKFRSSMTLFARAEPGETLFREALDLYFDGREDDATVRLLYNSGG